MRTGKKVAVVGSGPAGLAAAQQLNRAGHHVTVFERADRPGGLLMYGIPDFKLEKSRGLAAHRPDGGRRRRVPHAAPTSASNVPVDAVARRVRRDSCCTGGATQPRDLPIPGRELTGVHFAMEFLPQQNKVNQGDELSPDQILATGKHVIVIGGGDTGSDCTGTSNRHGCASLTQFELFPHAARRGPLPARAPSARPTAPGPTGR